MQRKHVLYLSLVALAVLLAAQLAYYFPQMPETMATHFGGNGHPDGWGSRGGFVGFTVGMFVFIVGVFLAIPLLLRVTPVWMINMPNKDYWLAPERKASSLEKLRSTFLSAAVAHGGLMLAVNQLVFAANLRDPARITMMWWVLGAYAVWFAVWMVHLFLMFRRPANA